MATLEHGPPVRGRRLRQRVDATGRNPYEMIGEVRLSPTEKQLLELLYDMRIARTSQMVLASGRNIRLVQRALQRLYEHKFMDRFFTWQLKGSSQGVYYLDALGAHYLSAIYEVPRKEIWEPRDNLLKEDKVEHTLNITEIRAALENDIRARADQNYVLERFWGEKRVGRRLVQGGTLEQHINPDGEIFILEILGLKRVMTTYLLEYDRGTEDYMKIKEKLAKYKAYYTSTEFKKLYRDSGIPDPDLLIITDGEFSERRFTKAISEDSELQNLIRIRMVDYKVFLDGPMEALKAARSMNR